MVNTQLISIRNVKDLQLVHACSVHAIVVIDISCVWYVLIVDIVSALFNTK